MTRENGLSAPQGAAAALAPDADLLDRLRRYRRRLAEQGRDLSVARLDAAIAEVAEQPAAASPVPPRLRRGPPHRCDSKPV